MTGMKPNVARMWLPGEQESLSEDMLEEHFGIKKEKLEELRRLATEAIEKGQAGFLAKRNKKQGHNYKIGELVWVKNHRASKWQARYHGPYKVSKVISDVIIQIVLNDETMKKDLVHVDYVKPHYSRDGSPAATPAIEENEKDVSEEVNFPEHYEANNDPDEVLIEGTSQGNIGKAITAEDKMARPDSPANSPAAAVAGRTSSGIRSALRSFQNLFSRNSEPNSVQTSEPVIADNSESDVAEISDSRAGQVIEFPTFPTADDPPRYLAKPSSTVKRDRRHEISRTDRALLEENREKGIDTTLDQGRATRSRRKV
jgi:hypothetical protein